jgi:hypothetical protein
MAINNKKVIHLKKSWNFKYVGVTLSRDNSRQTELQEGKKKLTKYTPGHKNFSEIKRHLKTKTDTKEHNNTQNINLFVPEFGI